MGCAILGIGEGGGKVRDYIQDFYGVDRVLNVSTSEELAEGLTEFESRGNLWSVILNPLSFEDSPGILRYAETKRKEEFPGALWLVYTDVTKLQEAGIKEIPTLDRIFFDTDDLLMEGHPILLANKAVDVYNGLKGTSRRRGVGSNDDAREVLLKCFANAGGDMRKEIGKLAEDNIQTKFEAKPDGSIYVNSV